MKSPRTQVDGDRNLQPVTFSHLTLQTGHVCEQTRFRVDGGAADYLLCRTSDGPHTLLGGYVLLVSRHTSEHVTFSVHNGSSILVACHACLDAAACDDTWQRVLSMIRKQPPEPVLAALSCPGPYDWHFRTPPLRQPKGLFLAVWLCPLCELDPEALSWLGDFERCIYWALWNRRQSGHNHANALDS
jgi:hypothetical protein